MNSETERAAFEADAAPYGFDLDRANNVTGEPWCDYVDDDTGHRWGGWLAARAALAVQAEPVAWCDPSNLLNSEAFAWPGQMRLPRHSMPLYALPVAQVGMRDGAAL